MKKIFVTLFLITFSNPILAERLMPIEFVGQPLLHMENGRPSSCGIRILGVQNPISETNLKEMLWVPDGSFMIARNGLGLVKAVAGRISVKNAKDNKTPIGQVFKSFWLKAEGKQATLPIKSVINGENDNSLLYATNFESVMDLIMAVTEERVLQFALKFKNGDDIAFYGKVRLEPEEENQLLNCMQELTNLIRDDMHNLNEQTAKPKA